MNVLDLFSGIGGFSLGLERAGFKTAAFCEIDFFCRSVLAKHWPDVPRHTDIRQLNGRQFIGTVDVVCGGYPCQPFSEAGSRKGASDERHLWPEMLRIIRTVRPRWVISENVDGHVSLGFDEVAASLEAEDFTVWPFVIPACSVGACHRRDRLWIVANSNSAKRRKEYSPCDGLEGADSLSQWKEGSGRFAKLPVQDVWKEAWETRLEEIRRVDDGISDGLDSLRALGNTIVPQIAQLIGQAILNAEAA